MAGYPGAPMPPAGPPQGPVTPPSSINNAVMLMYVGAALAIVNAVLGIIFIGDAVKEATKGMPPEMAAQAESAAQGAGMIGGIIGGLVVAGLWVWMAIVNKKGRNWGRITATVFFGIATLGVVLSLVGTAVPGLGGASTAQTIGSIVSWLVGLGAVVFMWQGTSSQFYQANS